MVHVAGIEIPDNIIIQKQIPENISNNYTMGIDDHNIIVENIFSNITVTLPLSSESLLKEVIVLFLSRNNSSYKLTIQTQDDDIFHNGSTSVKIVNPVSFLKFKCIKNGMWLII